MSITADLPRSAQRPTYLRHLVLAALLVITTINYVQRNATGPAATTIEEKLGVTGPELDQAAAAFFVAYTLMQVPSGWLAQRWGARLTLPFYAAGWSLALVFCARATGFLDLYIGRLAMGAFQAGIFPCATLILQVWYPSTQRGLATALLSSSMSLGSAGGSMLAGELLEPLGWRGLFLAYAVPGFIWAGWFIWWFRNHPAEHPGVNQAERDLLAANPPAATTMERSIEGSRPAVPWLLILTSVPLILLFSQQFCRAGALRLFETRLPTYLEKERLQGDLESRRKLAAMLSSYPQWAVIFGSILGGALSDYVLRRTGKRQLARNGIAILSLLSATTFYLAAWFVADVTQAILVLSTGAFFFSVSSPCAYALCIDIGGKNLAVIFGLMNMIGNLGATVVVSSIMILVKHGGWELALGCWLLLHVIALVCWLFLNPDVVIGEAAPVRLAE